MESEQTGDVIKTPENAWLFDVDGIITNPSEKEITEPDMIPEILKRLKRGEPVALVSGRALPWLITQVVEKIEKQVDDKNILDNLFISAEFGGISVEYENGRRIETVDEEVRLPQELIEKASEIVEDEFSDVAFVDTEKQTHFTAEMVKSIPMEEFRKRQDELSIKLQAIISESDSAQDIEIHNDRIATNVKNKKLNKHLATQKVLQWLENRRIDPQLFQVFGDSPSDLEIGRELKESGKNLKFIYVGEEELDDQAFEVIHQGGVDSGTLEYLKTH